MTDIRAAQALSILENLERLEPSQQLHVARAPNGEWLVWVLGRAPHAGSTLTDALGQLCTVIALNGADA